MKRLLLGLVGLCFIGIAPAEGAPQTTYRDFTSTDGRSIKGRIIKYDADLILKGSEHAQSKVRTSQGNVWRGYD